MGAAVQIVDNLPDLGGQITEDCPSFTPSPCWEDCKHVNEILEAYYNYENYSSSTRHLTLTKAILETQDQLIQDICNFEFDLCVLGAIKGFPCVQCGYVCDKGFQQCGITDLNCGYKTINPCGSICEPVCNACIECEIDFTSTPDLLALYENVINALSGNYEANASGIMEYADMIFQSTSQVVSIENNNYYLYVGRALTDVECSAIPLLIPTFPLPIGMNLTFVEVS